MQKPLPGYIASGRTLISFDQSVVAVLLLLMFVVVGGVFCFFSERRKLLIKQAMQEEKAVKWHLWQSNADAVLVWTEFMCAVNLVAFFFSACVDFGGRFRRTIPHLRFFFLSGQVSLFRTGTIHNGPVNRDNCRPEYPDELRASSFTLCSC